MCSIQILYVGIWKCEECKGDVGIWKCEECKGDVVPLSHTCW